MCYGKSHTRKPPTNPLAARTAVRGREARLGRQNENEKKEMRRKQVKLKWSKREKDWLFDWPDNAGATLAGVFFGMTQTTGHRTDWQEDLKKMLTDRGYDYKSFRIICDKLPEEK